MKKGGILAGVMVLAAGATVFLLTGDDPICPEECPGKHCMPMDGFCLVVDHQDGPVRMNADAEITLESDEIPADERIRLLGCCVEQDGVVRKVPRWISVADGMPEGCLQLTPPSLYPAISMKGVDLGHARQLNQACCKRDEGPVHPGNWGQCPYCTFRCQAGQAVPDPGGCDEFCKEEVSP